MTRTALVLVAFTIIFSTLCVVSYTQKSATWDEPQHLATGYLALRQHDYRLDPEHPPFLRMWMALPLTGVHADTSAIDKIEPVPWVGAQQFFYAHDFLYKQNDADRLLYRARFMNVLLGVLLGVLLFCWAHEWLGFWPATVTLALYCIEPNLQAHASLVTTDFGITCFIFGTLYFLWRTCRRASAGNIAGLAVFFALAIVSKFSSLILGPVVLVLLLTQTRRLGWRRIAGIVGLLFVASWLMVWAVYGFRYAPSANPNWLFHFDREVWVMARAPTFARLVGWCDAHRLVPNVFSQGFLLGQSKAQVRGAFWAGQYSNTGWWYYFPAAFAIKTPVALMVLFVAGLGLSVRRWRDALFIVVPLVIHLATAMAQRLNIGLRHILPLYPLVLLIAAVSVAELRNRRLILGLLLALWGMEFAWVYPSTLAFFNSFVGGPRNGYRYLVDSNLDWGQDLKPLKRWMDQHQVKHINLAYFGTADPAYYGIECTQLPGAPFFASAEVRAPQLPGYVAVSATLASGVYLDEAGRAFYRPLRDRVPEAVLGNTIFIYRVEAPWWR